MTQSIPKGGNAVLAQADPAARTVFIGLNWDASPVAIDASVFLLNASGVVRDDRDFVFYNQETDASGAVYRVSSAELDPTHDRDGFVVVLPTLAEDVQRLVFCLTLEVASAHDVAFGAVPWVRAHVVNRDSGQELFHYRSDELGTETALILAELYRHRDGWKFRAVGQGFAGGLPALAAHFGILVADEDSPSANVVTTDEAAFTTLALTLDKDAAEPAATGGSRRRRRTLQDLLATQVEDLIVKPLNFRSAIEEWRSLLRHDLQYRFAKESGGACA